MLERDLGQAVLSSDISAIFGIGNSGGSNIAVDRKGATAEAISFDRDYSIYRFGRDRRQAFTVHP